MAETVIAGKGMGGRTRVTSTEPAVLRYLEEAERGSYGREAERQGTSRNTFWCSQSVVRQVEELIAE